jgi:hypothetical protein
MENNGIGLLEQIALAIGMHSRLILGTNHLVASSQVIGMGQWDSFHKPVAIEVHLIKLTRARLLSGLQTQNRASKDPKGKHS